MPEGLKLDENMLGKRFNYIEEVECNEEYCLIQGINKNGKTTVQRHDAQGFTDITPVDVYNVHAIGWNGSEWLLTATRRTTSAGDIKTVLGLYSYDGNTLTELLRKKDAPAVGRVDSLGWNGNYWLIGLTMHPTTQRTGNLQPGLFRFNGGHLQPVSMPVEGLPGDVYMPTAIAWNGSAWLIALSGYKSPPVFLEYDGKAFHRVDAPAEAFSLPRPDRVLKPVKLSCNQKYCLLFLDNNRIVRFNGAFTRINTTLEDNPLYAFDDAEWNGNYWLISYQVDPPSGGGFIVKYDGEEFKSLTEMPSNCVVGGMEWNGEYWLIGTNKLYCNRWALMKYDGEKFYDLTGDFNEGMKSGPRKPEKGICGPAVLLLLALLPAAAFRRLWRK